MEPTPIMTLETDASNSGWGAVCGNSRTFGHWSQEESLLYINCRELLAGAFALKIFADQPHRLRLSVLLRMDNRSAVSYINKMGGTHSRILSSIARDLWEWCFAKNIVIRAEYLPGLANTEADRESRRQEDSSNWMLDREVFQRLNIRWGPLAVDLFASRLNAQLSDFVSWRPDPEAIASDALSLRWPTTGGYAFPHSRS